MADGFAVEGYLGVRRSITGRHWRERPHDGDLAASHRRRLGLSEPVARALAARGVVDAEAYLRPTLKATFPDPSSFAGMDDAARVLVDALTSGRRTTVFADYDVDGASSAALLVRWFRAMGRDLPIYVPDREREGFGPTPAAFRRLRDDGVELVVTVDCGAAAHVALETAADIGLDVVVVDHHLMRGAPSRVTALVNPNQSACGSGQGVLAAAGVTFVLLAALNREARRRGLFAAAPEPDLRQWLDLAAFGAICDVTRLEGFNRTLAHLGLKVMGAWLNPGLAALMAAADRRPGPPGVFEAGFVLGPRINAGGRIGASDLGARLLATDDAAEAAALAGELHRLNAERQQVEREILAEAVGLIERENAHQPEHAALVVAGAGWRPGVVGIVASRLRESRRQPVVVIGVDAETGIGKGSGRSQPGVNLGRAIHDAFDAGLLLAGGGHAMAAGLTLRAEAIPEFRAFLCQRLAAEAKETAETDRLDIDALTSTAAAEGLVDAFAPLQPFGPGNPEPVAALARVRCESPTLVRGGHVRVRLVDDSGRSLQGIAWRAAGEPIGQRLLAGEGALHVAGRLRANSWQGRDSLQLEIDDVAEARTP
ncbi:MAG: single-stranded-DNA-specific exonuclease RecJ [Caulobacteraceae bacterium]|nr:single-stranded-DNA-specific exonuclease RecJ [Caulobacteraceae bacterium]